MPRRKAAYDPTVVTYRTRKLPREYLNRMRVLACLCEMELEDVCNLVFDKGLHVVEEEKGVPSVVNGAHH
jgi:hypothetical protein